MTTTEELAARNNSANIGGINANPGNNGVLLNSLPLRTGLSSGVGTGNIIPGLVNSTTNNNVGLPIGGTLMGVGGGVGNDARDITYSTKNQDITFSTGKAGQTTTTTTRTTTTNMRSNSKPVASRGMTNTTTTTRTKTVTRGQSAGGFRGRRY